jgi:hypothetical protein
MFNGRTFLSNDEVLKLSKSNPAVYQQIAGLLTLANDFVLNINGTLRKIPFDELSKCYKFENDPIRRDTILNKCYICEDVGGIKVPVDVTLRQAYVEHMPDPESNLVMPWFRVTYDGRFEELYFKVDSQKTPDIMPYVPDTKKNYYVTVFKGDISTARLITEESFAYMYDLRGKSLNYERVPMEEPKPLFELAESTKGVKTFSVLLDNIIKRSYNNSFMNRQGTVKDFSTTILSRDALAITFKEHLIDKMFVAFKDGDDYCFSHGDYNEFVSTFQSNTGKYLIHLKRCIMFKDTNYKLYISLLKAFISLEDSSILSNYFVPPLNEQSITAIKEYTGQGYRDINHYLQGKPIEDEDQSANKKFHLYVQALYLQELIDCSFIVKDSYHFRGCLIDEDTYSKCKAGYVLTKDCFVSTSKVFGAAPAFTYSEGTDKKGIILVFKNTQNTNALYLENFSNQRGCEYEVLFGVGTGFELVRKLGCYQEVDDKPVDIWLCKVKDDPNASIKKYQYKKSNTEQLVWAVQSNLALLDNKFYIAKVEDNDDPKIYLENYGTGNQTIIIQKYGDMISVEFTGIILKPKYIYNYAESCMDKHGNISELHGYAEMFRYMRDTLDHYCLLNNSFDGSKLTVFSEQFMSMLLSAFLLQNYVISEQKVNSNIVMDLLNSMFPAKSTTKPYDRRTGKLTDERESEFTLLDADAKPIKFKVTLSNDKDFIYAKVDSKYHGHTLHKEVKTTMEKRNDLYFLVCSYIAKSFPLSPERRLVHIFSILSGYLNAPLQYTRNDEHLYLFQIEDYKFAVKISGNQIDIMHGDKNITDRYSNDIYQIAEHILAIM